MTGLASPPSSARPILARANAAFIGTLFDSGVPMKDQGCHGIATRTRGRVPEPAGRMPDVDLIPPQWLHMTMQGIGFTD